MCLLEYSEQGALIHDQEIYNPDELGTVLSGLREDVSVQLRLFVVEDLSRAVIEALGFHFKIDPSFFREQIVDSDLYSIRMLGQEISYALNGH